MEFQNEEWRPVVGFEEIYAVSSLGRVKRVLETSYARSGIILRQRTKNGYKTLGLSKNNYQRAFFVHRLVAIAFIANPEGKHFVNHIDSNRGNNSLVNLEWCTRIENAQHAKRNGRYNAAKGENQWAARLTEAEVIKIISLASEGSLKRAEIGKIFNVSGENVSSIIHRRTWRHVWPKIELSKTGAA